MKLPLLTTPELLFNLAAVVSLVASIIFWFLDEHLAAVFVGLWVPSIIGWMNFFKLKERDR